VKAAKKNAVTGKEVNLIDRKTRKKTGNRHLMITTLGDYDSSRSISFSDDEKALAMSNHYHSIIKKMSFNDMNNNDNNSHIYHSKHVETMAIGIKQISNNNNNNNNNHDNNKSRQLNSESDVNKISTELPIGFDWRAYLQLNPDLIQAGLITKKLAVEHYLTIGHKESRQFTGKDDVIDGDMI